jgi:hypothetical protein
MDRSDLTATVQFDRKSATDTPFETQLEELQF